MILKPLPLARAANAVPGLIITSMVWPVWSEGQLQTWTRWAVICTVIVAGSVLAIRGYRMGITCLDDRATIRGYFRTRLIRRNQITEVTDLPAIVWHDQAGHRHWSPVIAFTGSGGVIRRYHQHNTDCTQRLNRWIKGRK